MFENDLLTLVRSTLLSGFTSLGGGFAAVKVRQAYQPSTVGTAQGPQALLQTIGNRRYGALRRDDIPPVPPATDMTHIETQWWETTIQVGAEARRNPQDPAFLTLPSAMDICKAASDILQSDTGLSALSVQRVRPLRITEIRNVRFVNESDQYEAMPSFDIVLVYPQTRTTTTPPVSTFEPNFGRV